jgi:carbon monoxide dehydrogenase subunit G
MKTQFKGSDTIENSYERVWSFITNPALVGPCIPNVVDSRATSATDLVATVKVGVGPVSGKFEFSATLTPKPDEKRVLITIHGEGLGTIVDQDAQANCNANGATTQLEWSSEATISGKLASIGGRLLEKQAEKIIQQFFVNMRNAIGQAHEQVQ